MIQKKSDKQVLSEWEEFKLSIYNSTTIDANETIAEKKARMKRLEAPGNEEEWFKYYFPKFCFSACAKFHRKSTKKFLYSKRLYQCRPWARGLSKSVRRMMEVFYKSYVLKFETNCLLISKNQENAERLLAPYRANLEANQKLINDYGDSERFGMWTSTEFITKKGKAFRAVGAGQNPRGARVDERRPNMIIFDDIDDDEVCRNPDRVKQLWDWIDDAVIGTVELARDYCICFDNNIIAEHCIMKIAMQYADDKEIINIRDENGVSTWPEKNSEADIDYIFSKKSWASIQKEYFNNPIVEGKVFKELTWGKVPPLKKFKFLVAYADPAPSNRDKTGKDKRSYKSISLVGNIGLKYYLIKCFLDQTNNDEFVDWFFVLREYVGDACPLYMYIENNTLQDPFFQQLFKPMFYQKSLEKGVTLSITPDETKKADKFVRIEATLEPLVRFCQLEFNEEEKNNPHMQTMAAQFMAFSPTAKYMDGPDGVQGAVKIIETKNNTLAPDAVVFISRKGNKKRM